MRVLGPTKKAGHGITTPYPERHLSSEVKRKPLELSEERFNCDALRVCAG